MDLLEWCEELLNLAPVRVFERREAAVPLRRQELLRSDRRQAQGGGRRRRRGRRTRVQEQKVIKGERIAMCLVLSSTKLGTDTLAILA